MTCLEPPPTATLTRHDREQLRTLLLKVRWPGREDPYVASALVQGALLGLRMAGALDAAANQRLFWLLADARDRRNAERLLIANC